MTLQLGVIVRDPRAEHIFESVEMVQWVVERSAIALALDAERLVSKLKYRSIVWPRQAICYVLHHAFGYSLPVIGRGLDRDHTTVMHSVRQVAARRAAGDDATRAQIAAICGAVGLRPPASDDEPLTLALTLRPPIDGLPRWVTPRLLVSETPAPPPSAPRPPARLVTDPPPTVRASRSGSARTKRRCLACGSTFVSQNFGHRMCGRCRSWASANSHLDGVEA